MSKNSKEEKLPQLIVLDDWLAKELDWHRECAGLLVAGVEELPKPPKK